MNIKKEFKKVLPGSNFMTPDTIKYGETTNFIWELSTGDIQDKNWYGVTVIQKGQKTHRADLSNLYDNRTAAERYIEDLEENDWRGFVEVHDD